MPSFGNDCSPLKTQVCLNTYTTPAARFAAAVADVPCPSAIDYLNQSTTQNVATQDDDVDKHNNPNAKRSAPAVKNARKQRKLDPPKYDATKYNTALRGWSPPEGSPVYVVPPKKDAVEQNDIPRMITSMKCKPNLASSDCAALIKRMRNMPPLVAGPTSNNLSYAETTCDAYLPLPVPTVYSFAMRTVIFEDIIRLEKETPVNLFSRRMDCQRIPS